MTPRGRRRALGVARFALPLALPLALLLAPLALPAQGLPPLEDLEPPTQRGGFFASVSPFAVAAFTSEDLTGGVTRSGSGFALAGGYGITERLWAVLDITRTDLTIESGSAYNLWHIEPLARLNPWPWRLGAVSVVPYVDIGGGLVRASGERPNLGGVERISYSGSFVTAGAGAQVFVSRRWAVGGGAHASIGVITDIKRGNVTQSTLQVRARTSRANLAVSWYPQRRD